MALSVSAAARVLMINSQVLLLAILEERARMELRYKVFGRCVPPLAAVRCKARDGRDSDCCYLLCMRRRRELYSSVFALCLLPEMQKSFDCRLESSFVDAQWLWVRFARYETALFLQICSDGSFLWENWGRDSFFLWIPANYCRRKLLLFWMYEVHSSLNRIEMQWRKNYNLRWKIYFASKRLVWVIAQH